MGVVWAVESFVNVPPGEWAPGGHRGDVCACFCALVLSSRGDDAGNRTMEDYLTVKSCD